MTTTAKKPQGRSGSVRRRGDAWEARWYAPDGARRSSRRWLDEHGKPGATFKTAAEAQRFATEKQTESRRARDGRGSYADRATKVPTFAQAFQMWMETSPGSTPKTRSNYVSIGEQLLAEFGPTPLDQIGPTRLKRYKAKMEKAGKAPGTIKNHLRVMSPIFELAIDEEWITRNPARRVKISKSGGTRASILTPTQVELLADSIDAPYRALVLTAAYSGARWGELAALRWRHVIITRRASTDERPEAVEVNLTIETSVAEISMSDERRARWGFDDVGLVYGSTKNKRSRDVRLPSFLLDVLGPPKHDEELIFTTAAGTALRPDNFRKRIWAPAVAKARASDATVPANFRFHDLRHSCASLLISKGFSPKAIMTHMGHSQIGVTFDTYGHLFDDAFDELSDVLDDVRTEALAMHARSKIRAAVQGAA